MEQIGLCFVHYFSALTVVPETGDALHFCSFAHDPTRVRL